ncbi:cold-shock protein [Nocardia takedensis]
MTAIATPTDPDPNPLRPRPRRGTAVVAWYNTEKGFGFLTPDRGGPPIFLRHNAIAVPGYRTLRPGQTVRYTATDTPRGPEATHVEPLDPEHRRASVPPSRRSGVGHERL